MKYVKYILNTLRAWSFSGNSKVKLHLPPFLQYREDADNSHNSPWWSNNAKIKGIVGIQGIDHGLSKYSNLSTRMDS